MGNTVLVNPQARKWRRYKRNIPPAPTPGKEGRRNKKECKVSKGRNIKKKEEARERKR